MSMSRMLSFVLTLYQSFLLLPAEASVFVFPVINPNCCFKWALSRHGLQPASISQGLLVNFLPLPTDYCPHQSCSRDYILIDSEPKTWFEARAYCRERYTDLATVSNARDMNILIDKTDNIFPDFWIGLYEDIMTWRWSLPGKVFSGDGEAEFRNWGVGEPSEKSGIQHCASIQHTGEWKDLDCNLLHYFLCFDGNYWILFQASTSIYCSWWSVFMMQCLFRFI